MRILALTLILLLIPTVVEAPIKHIPPKPKVEQRAKQEPRKVMFEVTAYTIGDKGMSGKGITASGKRAIPWRTVAASRSLPMGTRIFLPQLNKVVIVHDRGGAIKKSHRLDLCVEDKQTALKWGRRKLEGVILE